MQQEVSTLSPHMPVEDLERPLSPDEFKKLLSDLKTQYCTKLKESVGVGVVFPPGTKIGEEDMSGKFLEDALNALMSLLEHYEPPIQEKETETKHEESAESLPEWLKGHESLIWHGAHDNPLWDIKAKQYGKEVRISYTRRSKELKPGKDETEQERTLEAVDDTFTIDEWKVAKRVFDHYRAVYTQFETGSKFEIDSKKARNELMDILHEENVYRRGREEKEDEADGEKPKKPEILFGRVDEAIKHVAKTTRGFERETIDREKVAQRIGEMLSQLLVLNRSRGDGGERVPHAKKGIKEIPSFAADLEGLAERFDRQNSSQKGMALMMGEAGTGKSELVEYFAAKTNRPFFWFPCGRGMEGMDLVSRYEFDSHEGTKRFLTDIADGIMTPGAIVYINEINALKPEVQAVLHGLGDSKRTFSYDGARYPMAEGALIVIDGNPATYGSAGDIGKPLLSRTMGQTLSVGYPSLTKGELQARKEGWSEAVLLQKETEDNTLRDYAANEVRVLFPELNEFAGLDDKDFALLWDYVVNEQTQGARVQEVLSNERLKSFFTSQITQEHIKKTLLDLRDILRIADAWRKSYKARQGFDLVGISMRETEAVAHTYAKVRDVRKAYMEVFKIYEQQPIEGLDATLLELEQLIDNTLGSGHPPASP